MIKILIIAVLINVSLFARLNPFEPDTNYNNTVKINETTIQEDQNPIPIKKPLMTKDDGKRTVKVEGSDTKKVLLKRVEKTKTKIIIKEKIVKVKPTKEELKALCKVEKEAPTVLIAKKEINPILVKEETKVIKHYNKKSHGVIPRTYKILPFVTIDTDYNSLKVTSRPQYHIVTYHVLKSKRKVAVDFLADVWFYTRYKNLTGSKFKSYTVGNHKRKGFFRVTIDLKQNIKNYTVSIKNNTATIKYK